MTQTQSNDEYSDAEIQNSNLNSTLINSISNNEAIENPINITIFPNPTEQYIWININEKIEITVEIFDVYGQSVYSAKLSNQNSKIDLSGNPKGTYFIKIINQENLLKFEKIILQ